MADALAAGFTQATDLAEYVVQVCRIDYRTAYLIVGRTVRAAAAPGLRGVDITGEMLDDAAVEHRGTAARAGRPRPVRRARPPAHRARTRSARGGAAPDAVAGHGRRRAGARRRRSAASDADRLAAGFDAAEAALLAAARRDASPTARRSR